MLALNIALSVIGTGVGTSALCRSFLSKAPKGRPIPMPLAWRLLVALAVYLHVRFGELEALAQGTLPFLGEWEDVDLDRGIIHVHRAINREDGEVNATKTDTPRKFPIEPPSCRCFT